MFVLVSVLKHEFLLGAEQAELEVEGEGAVVGDEVYVLVGAFED